MIYVLALWLGAIVVCWACHGANPSLPSARQAIAAPFQLVSIFLVIVIIGLAVLNEGMEYISDWITLSSIDRRYP